MAHNLYSASAPGSLMLMGEHAVLASKTALVCAVNKRIKVKLIPDTSRQIKLQDATRGNLTLAIDQLQIIAPFEFVLSSIILFKNKINSGFTLEIEPEFSSVIGLGSSAAVSVATIAVVANYVHGKPLAAKKVFALAKQAVLAVQGAGSGADIAASVFGGVLGYKAEPAKFIPLPKIPDLTAVFCGYKKPTKEVIAQVRGAQRQRPKLYASIFAAMQVCVKNAIQAIKKGNWQELGQLFLHHQGLQHALGVSDASLDTLVRQLSNQPQIQGAKISGSGLGDCVIGLGTLTTQVFPVDAAQQQQGVQQFAIAIEQQGLKYGS